MAKQKEKTIDFIEICAKFNRYLSAYFEDQDIIVSPAMFFCDKKYPETCVYQVPALGKIKFRANTPLGNYESEVFNDPNWLEIMRVCNEMLLATDERKYIYLDDFAIVKKVDEVQIAEFIMEN